MYAHGARDFGRGKLSKSKDGTFSPVIASDFRDDLPDDLLVKLIGTPNPAI